MKKCEETMRDLGVNDHNGEIIVPGSDGYEKRGMFGRMEWYDERRGRQAADA